MKVFASTNVSKPDSAGIFFYQISRQEQVLDTMRNVTTTPEDHVKNFTFKGGGGSWSNLFDGTEKVLSWDHPLAQSDSPAFLK